jgi:L-threonylcarbamoyladenylate synthase
MYATTFTNTPVNTPPPADLLGPTLRHLRYSGIVLLPTDSLWCVACDATDPVATKRLTRLCPPQPELPVELLFPDVEALRAATLRLHPRLETLLAFHRRPLAVITEPAHRLPAEVLHPDGYAVARVAQDPFCARLTRELGRPLALAAAQCGAGPPPTHFGRVRSDIITGVDYTVKFRQREQLGEGPAVMVRYNEETAELEFLRE